MKVRILLPTFISFLLLINLVGNRTSNEIIIENEVVVPYPLNYVEFYNITLIDLTPIFQDETIDIEFYYNMSLVGFMNVTVISWPSNQAEINWHRVDNNYTSTDAINIVNAGGSYDPIKNKNNQLDLLNYWFPIFPINGIKYISADHTQCCESFYLRYTNAPVTQTVTDTQTVTTTQNLTETTTATSVVNYTETQTSTVSQTETLVQNITQTQSGTDTTYYDTSTVTQDKNITLTNTESTTETIRETGTETVEAYDVPLSLSSVVFAVFIIHITKGRLKKNK